MILPSCIGGIEFIWLRAKARSGYDGGKYRTSSHRMLRLQGG